MYVPKERGATLTAGDGEGAGVDDPVERRVLRGRRGRVTGGVRRALRGRVAIDGLVGVRKALPTVVSAVVGAADGNRRRLGDISLEAAFATALAPKVRAAGARSAVLRLERRLSVHPLAILRSNAPASAAKGITIQTPRLTMMSEGPDSHL